MENKEQLEIPKKILLVEDNPGDVRSIEEAFRESRMHYHLSTVGDGVEAMEFLERTGKYASAPFPDVILLDLNLPRKDGREVLHEIKTSDRLKKIPVVVLTGSKDEMDYSQATQYPTTYYITKPADMRQLMEFVRWFLEFFNTRK